MVASTQARKECYLEEDAHALLIAGDLYDRDLHSMKTAILEAGQWRATAENADPTTAGYHLSALYSPVGWLSWERIARGWEAAQGSDDAIRAFKNTILGETWGRVAKRRSPRPVTDFVPGSACRQPPYYTPERLRGSTA